MAGVSGTATWSTAKHRVRPWMTKARRSPHSRHATTLTCRRPVLGHDWATTVLDTVFQLPSGYAPPTW